MEKELPLRLDSDKFLEWFVKLETHKWGGACGPISFKNGCPYQVVTRIYETVCTIMFEQWILDLTGIICNALIPHITWTWILLISYKQRAEIENPKYPY